jgi:hypothetical protein
MYLGFSAFLGSINAIQKSILEYPLRNVLLTVIATDMYTIGKLYCHEYGMKVFKLFFNFWLNQNGKAILINCFQIILAKRWFVSRRIPRGTLFEMNS